MWSRMMTHSICIKGMVGEPLCIILAMSFLNKDHPTMYTEDYEEWRWGQILTRRKDYNPDDQPPVEDEEDAQTQE